MPPVFVVSVSPFNRHGMPYKSVLQGLHKIGTRLFRTDTMGAVRLVTDGRLIQIRPAVM